MDFTYDIEMKNPETAVVTVSGSIDAGTSLRLDMAIEPILGQQSLKKMVFDMINVDFISSSGIRLFMVVTKVLTGRNGKVYAVGLNARGREALGTAGMNPFLDYAASIEACL